jgi:hypothetical protein
MNISSVSPFNAYFMIGLEEGYTSKPIDKVAVFNEIQHFQQKLLENDGVYLSANVSESSIVLSGQVEPHLKIEFINYPKSNIPLNDLKGYIKDMAIYLMEAFQQNRIVISCPDEIIMLEEKSDLDPRIG